MKRLLTIAAVVAVLALGGWLAMGMTEQTSAGNVHQFTSDQCPKCSAWSESTSSGPGEVNGTPTTIKSYYCKNGHRWAVWLEPGG